MKDEKQASKCAAGCRGGCKYGKTKGSRRVTWRTCAVPKSE